MNWLPLVLIAGLYLAFVWTVFRIFPTPRSRTSAGRFLTGTLSRDDERCREVVSSTTTLMTPAPLVPNRYFTVWTVNLDHPRARLVVVLVVALLLVPIVLALVANLPGSGCHTSGCVA